MSEQLRSDYCKEKGLSYINIIDGSYKDYILWLEKKAAKNNPFHSKDELKSWLDLNIPILIKAKHLKWLTTVFSSKHKSNQVVECLSNNLWNKLNNKKPRVWGCPHQR